MRAEIIERIQQVTNASLVDPAGTATGTIGFDAFGDTINPVLTVYRVEDGQWTPIQP